MLKASAPQKRIRRGSCVFALVLDQRMLMIFFLCGSTAGLHCAMKRGNIDVCCGRLVK